MRPLSCDIRCRETRIGEKFSQSENRRPSNRLTRPRPVDRIARDLVTAIEGIRFLVLSLLLLEVRKKVGLVILAPVVQWTIRAMWADRPADKLAEFYEDLVQGQPVLPISKAGKILLSLLGRLCLDHPNSVENPVNMGIDGNRGCLEPVDEDTVSGLTPNGRKLKQLVHIFRDNSAILGE